MTFDPTEIESLKARWLLSAVFRRCGVRTSGGAGRVHWCLCPWHQESTASCKIDDFKGFYFCFGCGESGDALDAVMQLTGCSFSDAVNRLGGVRSVSATDRVALEKKRKDQDAFAQLERVRNWLSYRKAWSNYRPVFGTPVELYLRARGIPASADWTFDLRYGVLVYRGYSDASAQSTEPLGSYAAMVAAIRNAAGDIIGLHRTYLNEDGTKLSPPGDEMRNRSKKILGESKGGLIWLSRPCARICVGEGIETTRSWLVLHSEQEPETGACSGISLGNLGGRCTATLPHPKHKGMRVPNGIPDLEQPGIVWPEITKEILFLGDGDSDYAITSARLMSALRRAVAQGKTCFRHFAPEGMDFNDELRSETT